MKYLIRIETFLFASLFAILTLSSCSSDNKDTPVPPSEETSYPTMEQYQNQIANRLWVLKEAKWMDEDGNVLPELMDIIGYDDIRYYFFLDNGYISFCEAGLFSQMIELSYDPHTGCFYYPNNTICKDVQILSINDNEILIKNFEGHYRDDPDSPTRKDVYRLKRYVYKPDPDWKNILGQYPPSGYNPEDYGMK